MLSYVYPWVLTILGNIFLRAGDWVVADTKDVPTLKTLTLKGNLELNLTSLSTTGRRKRALEKVTITAEYIIIMGGRLVIGWPDKPYTGEVEIILTGKTEARYPDGYGGPPLGAMSIGKEYCKTHYYCSPFNFTHFALGDDNAYITGADIRSK